MRFLLFAPLLFIILYAGETELNSFRPNIGLSEQTIYDFGKINEEAKVTHKFKFKNTGDADLEIPLVKSSCKCMASLSAGKTIKPGEEGEILVTFNSTGYAENYVTHHFSSYWLYKFFS